VERKTAENEDDDDDEDDWEGIWDARVSPVLS
jgi:hypothetical protein